MLANNNLLICRLLMGCILLMSSLQLMAAIRSRLSPLSRSLVVPEPVMPLCSSGLIVMQRLRGASLTSLLAAAKAVGGWGLSAGCVPFFLLHLYCCFFPAMSSQGVAPSFCSHSYLLYSHQSCFSSDFRSYGQCTTLGMHHTC
jgi:hypothetical protein